MAVSDEYIEYLKSDTWQRLRSRRLAIDNYRCQRCGTPYGPLQVHHLAYPAVLGTEDVYRDLITLCASCHELIENQKHMYRKDKKDAIVERARYEKRLIYRTIRRMACYDRSAVGIGTRDYCNLDVIREDFGPILGPEVEMLGYVDRVRTYFRNRRYKIILKMAGDGLSVPDIWERTGFSLKMITKVCADPDRARAILKNEEKEEEEPDD